MECTKKGNIPSEQIWAGTCYRCTAEFTATRSEVTVSTCPREHYEFSQIQCPECSGHNTLTLYPKKEK